MTEHRSSWEERAAHFGADPAGVLFRGLSAHANSAIDDWHSWVVREVFSAGVPMRGHVLDLGCGYGRLSKALLQDRPDIALTGLDASLRYSRMYGESIGAAVCADMAKLPFADAVFEGVMAVTSLMYATQRERGLVLREMARVLRPDGHLLLIDPGLEVQRLVAFVRGKRVESPTGGSGFERDEYREMTRAAGFDIEAAGGNLALSRLLLVPGVGSAGGAFVSRMLKSMARRDSRCDGYSALAMHRWLLARRSVAP